MQRYFTDKIQDNQAVITKEDHHHIKNVMRFSVGDEVSVCDLAGHCYEGTFQTLSEEIIIAIRKELPNTELPMQVTIAQALIRRERFEYMLQKGTELGMTKLIPLKTTYSIVDLDKKKEEKKIVRWQKIVQEASEQSRRNIVPEIAPIANLSTLDLSPYDKVFVAYEQEQNSKSLHKILSQEHPKNVLLVIGPEGGFHPKEIDKLKAQDHVHIVGLGKRILRSETASSYFLSVISYQYELGDEE